jgi:hypothetical protein
VSVPDHYGSWAYAAGPVVDRERWLHEISWMGFPVQQMRGRDVGRHILNGFEEARDRADRGMVEHPRKKLDSCGYRYDVDDPRVKEWQ